MGYIFDKATIDMTGFVKVVINGTGTEIQLQVKIKAMYTLAFSQTYEAYDYRWPSLLSQLVFANPIKP